MDGLALADTEAGSVRLRSTAASERLRDACESNLGIIVLALFTTRGATGWNMREVVTDNADGTTRIHLE